MISFLYFPIIAQPVNILKTNRPLLFSGTAELRSYIRLQF